jgi:hypothetical protein
MVWCNRYGSRAPIESNRIELHDLISQIDWGKVRIRFDVLELQGIIQYADEAMVSLRAAIDM